MIVGSTLLRFVVATVLLLASVAKLTRLQEFEQAVQRFDIVPVRFRHAFAGIVPAVELLLAAALFAGVGLREVSLASASLFLGFNVAVSWNLAGGKRFDCGCGAVGASDEIGVSLIVRNFGLAGAAVFIAVVNPTTFGLDSALSGDRSHLSATDSFALLATAVLAVLVTELGYSFSAWKGFATHRAVDL
jgi:uncharacterized membrane protein YphA (DoxX/SURF4 family)